ncbi:hypothetical protein [Aquibium sp. ELW1220]|uniref:hypothetical protein n=1 Tax=Aquibium sp. ELW1220 TaxID=2976766 RepID=UPI0025AECFDC|nr:hypothetical protein [Aquibium sp. ELW1220]MDN2582167.1 hypothetical protein [Aquibium sp. ELW1220]
MIDRESMLGKEAIRICLDLAGIAAYEIRPKAGGSKARLRVALPPIMPIFDALA